MDKGKQLAIGIFVALSLIGGTWYIAQEDQANLYQCDDIVGLCFKLSKVNDAGLQTRCYYNESAPRKYKNCAEGWVKAELVNFTGTETTLPDYEQYQIQTKFTNKQEAEQYIQNLKQSVTYDWKIMTIEQYPYSDVLDIVGIVRILKDEEIVDRLGIYDVVEETATKQEIESRMEELARESFERWNPFVIIDRSDKI